MYMTNKKQITISCTYSKKNVENIITHELVLITAIHMGPSSVDSIYPIDDFITTECYRREKFYQKL